MWWIQKEKSVSGAHQFVRDENGQAIIVVVFSIITLIAVIGLGVDLGVVFVERVRLARAMDAAALAGAQELPSEKAAHHRALEYLQANGYDTNSACVSTLGSTGLGGCPNPDASANITIDTIQFRDGGQENTAHRIIVHGSRNVPLNFLRVIGFDAVPIAASATAENIENLDISLVYDRSGSMQEDTRCYGCLANGTTYPLPFGDHCDPPDPVWHQGYAYISIEAEHYSSYLLDADYHRDWTEYPKVWWAMQRQPNRNASGPDSRGAWMMVGPHSQGAMHYPTIGDILYPPDLYTTPRLDYDFTVPTGGNYYVWMRAQGGNGWSGDEHKWVHVGRGGAPMATGATTYSGPYNDGASSDRWRWTRVLRLDGLNTGQTYNLNFWAAGPGFRLDKIVLTNDTRTNLMDYGHPLDWDFPGVSDAGPVETHGRTGWACYGSGHPTPDPRFVPIDPVTDKVDDLYTDFQPIGAAKEAAKRFVRRLNPELDQIAYVTYSSQAQIIEELYCKKHYGSCADFENVVESIDATYASGSTNIAQALWYGLLTLISGEEPPSTGKGLPPGPGSEHYGRPAAAHILILMTDGQANIYPDLPSGYGNCYSDDLWPDQPGESDAQRRSRECVAWFGQQARNQGVVVYTIGLGAQADNELLRHVAELTGGWYYLAPSADDLDEIFDSLYERIFLRLVN